jgi:16S rRNA (guanine966-N2)-methyltransferase
VRILRGKWAGRALISPGGRTRPTAESVRAAWLDALEPHLPGARVLDLFAGTGALGLEALSRGAARVDFVENGPASLHALKANVAALRVRERTRIFKRDALPFVAALPPASYRLALADPPYGSRMADRLLEHWQATAFADILSVEHARDHRLPTGGRTLAFEETAVTIYPATAAPEVHGTRKPRDARRPPHPRCDRG